MQDNCVCVCMCVYVCEKKGEREREFTKNIDSQAIHRTGNGIVPSTL